MFDMGFDADQSQHQPTAVLSSLLSFFVVGGGVPLGGATDEEHIQRVPSTTHSLGGRTPVLMVPFGALQVGNYFSSCDG